MEDSRTFSNLFYEANTNVITKTRQRQRFHEKQPKAQIYLMDIDTKVLSKMLENQIQQYIKKDTTSWGG